MKNEIPPKRNLKPAVYCMNLTYDFDINMAHFLIWFWYQYGTFARPSSSQITPVILFHAEMYGTCLKKKYACSFIGGPSDYFTCGFTLCLVGGPDLDEVMLIPDACSCLMMVQVL